MEGIYEREREREMICCIANPLIISRRLLSLPVFPGRDTQLIS